VDFNDKSQMRTILRLSLTNFRRVDTCPSCGGRSRDLLPLGYMPEVYPMGKLVVRLDRTVVSQRRLAHCRSCGLIYHVLIPKRSVLRNLADDLDKERHWGSRSAKEIFASLLATHCKPLKVLDVGCGRGEFLQSLPKNWVKLGVDPNRASVNLAKRAVPEGKFFEGFFEDLDLSGLQVDVVTLWDVVEHLDDIDGVFSSLVNLLKPGGVIMIQTGDTSSVQARLLGSSWNYYTVLDHFIFFNEVSIHNVLSKHGLAVECIEKTTHHYYVKPLGNRILRIFKNVVFILGTGGGRFPTLWQSLSEYLDKSISWGQLPGFRDHLFVIATRQTFQKQSSGIFMSLKRLHRLKRKWFATS